MKRSRRAASRGVDRFFLFCHFRLVWPENRFSGIHLGPPCHTITCPIVHPNTMQHALGAVLCVCKRWGVFGNVWGCLQPDMWFGDHLRVGPSQRGSDHKLAPRYPKTPPKHPHTLIYASYGVYTWCMRLWDAYGASAGLYMADKYAYVIPTCF